MFGMIGALFSYDFICRALIVGVLVSVCSALLGTSLVLKRYSMIGDGLSHVAFGAMTVAAAMNVAPLAVSVPVVIIAAFLLLRISGSSSIKGDAAIAMISSSSIAIGLIATSLTGGLNTDVYSYMFGSIYAISRSDMWIAIILSAVVIAMFVLMYNKVFAVTFDESFAAATGTHVGRYNTAIALLTAITIVFGMRIIGTMLISSLIIFPALTSMRVFRSFRSVVISSAAISVVCFVAGVMISFAAETPTSSTVVAANLAAFLIASAAGVIRRKFSNDRESRL
ncbi:MAG: metal ABC transporter permease [Clostridia bacterium]|nr:metal ABC transporter permease [Clostridia bacterium]